jgi:ubiquinone/menaquinone biosynthesis C-methylase UbiE
VGLWDRVWAAGYDFLGTRFSKIEEPHRRRLVENARGEVLEVGAGTGFNFPYYREANRVVALEPEEAMRRRSLKRAPKAAVPIEVMPGDGERLPFPDASFDTIVFALVLCTIRHPERSLAEARRVLRPDGEIRFYEHVRSRKDSESRWQDRLDRPWSAFNRGCHANRDTLATMEAAGLRFKELEQFDLAGAPGICKAHILGKAIRSEI